MSLAKLAEELKQSNHTFPYLRQSSMIERGIQAEEQEELLNILTSKGFFPYSLLRELDRLAEITEFPPIEAFANDLDEGDTISQQNYAYAKNVYQRLNCKSLKDYHDYYLKVDVYLLCEVFMSYAKKIHDEFHLHPARYLGTPSLAMDALLYHNKQKEQPTYLEFIKDKDLYYFFEDAVKGGMSYTSLRHFAHEEKHPQFQEEDSMVKAMFVDVNSLYSTAMVQKLPVSDFIFLTEEQIAQFDLTGKTWDLEGDHGYYIECDIDIPPEIHKKTNAYPLCPERVIVTDDMLSPLSKTAMKNLNKTSYTMKKLVATMFPKEKYKCHWKTLKLYIDIGAKITKIHRIVRFKQDNFVESFIRHCIKLRSETDSPFYKQCFKTVMNSLYGKFLESVRKRMEVIFETDSHRAKKHASKPTYVTHRIVNPDLVLFFHRKPSVHLDKLVHVGTTILDLSKHHMYDLWYNKLMPVIDSKYCDIITSDTDSFLFAYETNNPARDLQHFSSFFDFSNYDKQHPLYNNTNKAALGYIKDEVAGGTIIEAVALRPKTYAFQSIPFTAESSKTHTPPPVQVLKKLKGVGRTFVKKRLSFSDFKNALIHNRVYTANFHAIQQRKFINRSVVIRKLALSNFDTKRYYTCYKHSFAFGSSLIDKSTTKCLQCEWETKRKCEREAKLKQLRSIQ